MYTQLAIAPIRHLVAFELDSITEIIFKKKTHLYRIQRKRNTNNSAVSDTVYQLEHRFESMGAWNWIGAFIDPFTVTATIAQILNYEYGVIRDNEIQECDECIAPELSGLNELTAWFNLSPQSAVYISTPDHLPVSFIRTKQTDKHWRLSYDGDTSTIQIGSRQQLQEPWTLVDQVHGDISNGVQQFIQTSELTGVSPPTSTEIEDVWATESKDNKSANGFQ